ncbi:hypothetical protein AB395_0000998 [Sinorhizobium fredii CCBAU 45436]|nr:hypothetical protein SF83666_c09650 [Sinorhizobium fredii CCBAU 83666]AWI56674.1 hypothetical protein AB395_0000998 [Sinorhizobium fredii CCBAU 45436]AWM24472.1 hypothetical protein AOX55_00001197 [Sinorhizobium fredii CCBAU 25509]
MQQGPFQGQAHSPPPWTIPVSYAERLMPALRGFPDAGAQARSLNRRIIALL